MFFVSGSASLSFFYRSSLLRVAVWKKFSGANFCFLSVVVGLVFFDSVLPRFLFYFFGFSLPKMSRKILLMSGPLFEKIFGSELLFFGVGVGGVFFVAGLPMFFASIFWFFRSRKCLEKILLMSGPLFEKIFGSEVLFFRVSVLVVCFFVLFCLCFLLYYLVFRSRKCLEKILLMSGLVFLGFLDWLSGVFREDFSGPEMAHFCCPKTGMFSLSNCLSPVDVCESSVRIFLARTCRR